MENVDRRVEPLNPTVNVLCAFSVVFGEHWVCELA